MRTSALIVLAAAVGSTIAQSNPPRVDPKSVTFDISKALAARLAALPEGARASFTERTGLNATQIVQKAGLKARDLIGNLDPKLYRLARRQTQSAPLPCGRLWFGALRGLDGPSTCTTLTRSDQIDDPVNGLLTKSINNWASGRIPPSLRGTFYMSGNPLQSECFSMASSYYNATTDSYDTPMWYPRTWTGDPYTGVVQKAVTDGTTFQTKCKVASNGQLRCFNTQWERRTNELLYAGDFTCDEVGPNEFRRGSNVRFLPQTPVVPGTNISAYRYNYTMFRITDENGIRTPQWYSRYIPNINKSTGTDGQQFIHLKDTQEIGHRR